MELYKAVLLGIIEGLTEYLPVSSTGHLILLGHLLGTESDAAKTFEIVIQFGALMAVVAHYRALLSERLAGLLRGEKASKDLALALFIAFVPVAILGLLANHAIKQMLFGPVPVATALIVGGIIMIVVPRLLKARHTEELEGLEHVTPRRALAIGLGQCVSLWPGSSRSMCTILTGQITGLSTKTAAEFSFLLALPTLGAATVYELLKSWRELASQISVAAIVIGLVVSFFVAWGVISAFLRYLNRHGLAPFGFYRVAVGVAVFLLMVR